MPKIFLLDVTNRDGVQTAHLGLAKIEKTIVNMYLNEMGVTQSEFGFPTTHHETNYLNANLELADMGVLCPIRLSGWLRAVKKRCRGGISTGSKVKISQLIHFHIGTNAFRKIPRTNDS
jgi:isopropylmalate/homocitrate/citramalate synthase